MPKKGIFVLMRKGKFIVTLEAVLATSFMVASLFMAMPQAGITAHALHPRNDSELGSTTNPIRLNAGESVTRTLSKAEGQQDNYIITIPENGYYNINLDTHNSNATFEIRSQEKGDVFSPNHGSFSINPYAGSGGVDPYMKRMLYEAGTYEVAIWSSEDSMSYDFSISKSDSDMRKMKITKIKSVKNKLQINVKTEGTTFDYEVEYSTDKNFKTNVKSTFIDAYGKNCRLTASMGKKYDKVKGYLFIKRPKRGKTYYFRVRQMYGNPKSRVYYYKRYTFQNKSMPSWYNMLGRDIKAYSEWSNVKKFKVK